MTEKELNEKKKKENARATALKILRDETNRSFVVSYLLSKAGYGEAVDSAWEQFGYLPALQNSNNLLIRGLMDSRQDGRRYTGTFSEFEVIKNATGSMQAALNQITPQDLLELIGSEKKADKKYGNQSLAEIKDSGKEGEKLYGELVGAYTKYLLDTNGAYALQQSASQTQGGLEKILVDQKKK